MNPRFLPVVLLILGCTHVKPAAQNPSPMVDTTRAHERIVERAVAGRKLTIGDVLPRPVEVLVTSAATSVERPDLIIHFLGAPWLAMQAADDLQRPVVIAVVNLGAGSAVYARPFADGSAFDKLVSAIESATGKHFDHVYLTGFSAGYGAVRAILRTRYDAISGVLLLDGIHTSYIPEGKPLAVGGKLEETGLDAFHRLAADAVAEKKRFVVTHSEIFPGTFASTTETTDDLLQTLHLKRAPVVTWGPLGMQQLSDTRSGSFAVLGFAGNSAPDHIDHLHGYGFFLRMLLEPGFTRRAVLAASLARQR